MSDAWRDRFMMIVALLMVMGFFAFLAALFWAEIPTENSELLFTAAGVLFGGVGTVLTFFFGSSQGSKDKTDAMIRRVDATKETPDA